MDIQQIREFLRLGITLNFTKTAAELNVSQSALSKHIASLEKEVGTALFDRTTREVSLTRDGITFFNGCYAGIDAIDTALGEIRTRNAETEAITVCGDLRCPLVLEMVNDAMRGYERAGGRVRVQRYQPHTSTSFFSIAKNDVLDLVRSDPASLAVASAPLSLADAPDFCTCQLASEPLFAYIPLAHELAHRTHVELSELRENVFVFTTAFPLLAARVEEACRECGFAMRKAIRACDSIADYFDSHGVNEVFAFPESSIAILPKAVTDRHALIRITGSDAFVPVFAFWSRDALRSVGEFARFLHAQGKPETRPDVFGANPHIGRTSKRG